MNPFHQPTENEEDLEERIRRDGQAWNGAACNCGGEVYYCEECCDSAKAVLQARRFLNSQGAITTELVQIAAGAEVRR